MVYKKNELLFLISVSGSCFLFLFCLLFVSRCSFVFVFCFVSASSLVLVSSHAIIFVALHLVFLLLLFVFVALVFCYFLNCDDLSKTSLKNLEIPKTPKMRNAEKKQTFGQEQLAQVFSHIVFFFVFFCASLNFACFAENIVKLWFHPKIKVKHWSKSKLKTGPSLLRNNIGPNFNFENCFI